MEEALVDHEFWLHSRVKHQLLSKQQGSCQHQYIVLILPYCRNIQNCLAITYLLT